MKTNRLGAVQGDVPVLRVDALTLGGKKTQRRIVAVGEATGHNHIVVGDVECYEVERNVAGNLFRGLEVVVVEGQPAALEHMSGGEHETIELLPGIYFIPQIQQVEYDGADERRVVD